MCLAADEKSEQAMRTNEGLLLDGDRNITSGAYDTGNSFGVLWTLPKWLSQVALLFLVAKKSAADRERFSAILISISDCLAAIAMSIQLEEHAVESCAELVSSVAQLHDFLAEQKDLSHLISGRELQLMTVSFEGIFQCATIEKIVHSADRHKLARQAEEVRRMANVVKGLARIR